MHEKKEDDRKLILRLSVCTWLFRRVCVCLVFFFFLNTGDEREIVCMNLYVLNFDQSTEQAYVKTNELMKTIPVLVRKIFCQESHISVYIAHTLLPYLHVAAEPVITRHHLHD